MVLVAYYYFIMALYLRIVTLLSQNKILRKGLAP